MFGSNMFGSLRAIPIQIYSEVICGGSLWGGHSQVSVDSVAFVVSFGNQWGFEPGSSKFQFDMPSITPHEFNKL